MRLIPHLTSSLLLLGSACLFVACSPPADQVKHAEGRYSLRAGDDGSVVVKSPDGAEATFQPVFGVLSSTKDPKKGLRWMEFGEQRPETIMYNILSWTAESEAQDVAVDASGHVEDGFDPALDQKLHTTDVVDVFRAAPMVTAKEPSFEWKGDRMEWVFPETESYALRATVSLPDSGAEPVLEFHFTPKIDGWFSVGYLGAPAFDLATVEGVWQPLIWQDMRFPDQSYLTESGRCTLPATTVTKDGITVAVIADPAEMPFQPLPTVANSTFGVAVRNQQGQAQPMIFAPILGGVGSEMPKGGEFNFSARLFVAKASPTEAYARIAQGVYGFRDYRSNDEIGPLNQTFERMTKFAMGPYAKFNSDLRGAAYDTDVPGSVKNVSSLHPLGVALVTDSPEIFEERAKPMIEYGISRERFLFTTDPSVKGQGASANLNGPGVPISELTALEEMSGGRNPLLVDKAKALLPLTRSLNLDAFIREDSWENWLAIYRATGDQEWLAKAKAGADQYIAERIENRPTDFTDPEARDMFFWTNYAPSWIELLELYDVTNEQRYLDAAREGARRFVQYVYLCPVIPDEEVKVNEGGVAPSYRSGPKFPKIEIAEEMVPAWRVSEIGLTPESSGTSKGHRGILPNSFAAPLLRVAALTDDDFLRAIARSSIIGRYRSFPGYHMNVARTTVYEKADFAERPKDELNSVTSIHYNHIWPHVALVLDFLVADAEARSGGAIKFPGKYAEGYAYFQGRVFDVEPGKFFGRDAILWMPPGLLEYSDPEVNYLSAREGNKTVLLALANQSKEPRRVKLAVDEKLAGFTPGQTVEATFWDAEGTSSMRKVDPSGFEVDLGPDGFVAVALPGADIRTRLQATFGQGADPWKKATAEIETGGARAMVLNFGDGYEWGYVFLRERDGITKAKLGYSIDGGSWNELEDEAFPFEFSMPLPSGASKVAFRVTTESPDGRAVESPVTELFR
jgi:hypothetical protein